MAEELRTNKPHYHVWLTAKGGRIFYRLAWPFESGQAARQWANRNRPDQECMVRQCDLLKCAPKFE